MQVPQRFRVICVTDPLLTALPGHFNLPWNRAVRLGEKQVLVTARHTANLPILAGALVLAAGLKGLSALVNDPIEHTVISLYHHADSSLGAGVRSAVTEEAAALLARLHLRAAVAALAGTHQTARAVVQHRSHPGGARRRRLGAPGWAWVGAALSGRDLSQEMEEQESQAKTLSGQIETHD